MSKTHLTRIAIVGALSVAALAGIAPATRSGSMGAQTRTPEDPKLVWTASQAVLVAKQVAPGAYAVFADDASEKNRAGVPLATSGGFIVGNDAVLVVESMLNRRLARQLLALVRRTTNKPIRYVVNTSYHGDHSYGNSFFPAGIELIQHVETARYIAEHFADDVKFMQQYFGTNQGLDEVRPRRATTLLHDESSVVIDLGGRRVEIMHLGFAQTPGDLFVWLSAEKVLWTGNPVIAAGPAVPWLLDGRLRKALATLRKVRAMVPQDAVVVPGHGHPTDVSTIDHHIAYLARLDREVSDAIARGLSLAETAKTVTMPEFSAYKVFPWVHGQINVPKAYQELKESK